MVRIWVGEVEVVAHSTEQQRLLDVFLSEIRVRRLGGVSAFQMARSAGGGRTHLNDVEEPGDDRRYASEKVGTAGAFHLMAVPLDLDERALLQGDVLVYSRWIHVLDTG